MTEVVENTLAHYGVKGMKWGQTKAAGSTPQLNALPAKIRNRLQGGPAPATIKPKEKPRLQGGPTKATIKPRETSSDHQETRVLKALPAKVLTNRELERINTRLRLEQQNRQLQSRGGLEKVKKATAVVGTVIAVGTTVNQAVSFYNSPAGQAIRSGLEQAIKASARR